MLSTFVSPLLAPLLALLTVLPPVPGPLTRGFDAPAAPWSAGHRGVDLDAEAGEEVRAVLPGTVRFSGDVADVGWVSVDHGGGLVTSYGPVDPRLVHAGGRVRAGDVLGLLAGHAGHLDWGARLHGTYIDPLLLLTPWEPYLTQ